MSIDLAAPAATTETSNAPMPAAPPLVQRLVRDCGADWVDEHSVADWAAAGGDRVLLLAGDPVQFPEGLDVAVVLPELQRSLGLPLRMGAVPRASEDAVARRYGSQRWPSLIFLREGGYVGAIAGMHDWDVFQQQVREMLARPVSRAPGVGIPVVNANGAGSSCH